MLWRDLEPDPLLSKALDAAGPSPLDGDTSAKRNWGKRFADASAVMFADALRSELRASGLEIRPNPDGTGTEPLTGVGGGGKKKVDVIASSLSTGLQIAISLKAENFADSSGSFGKNFLNRVYELQDEVRSIHDYQPRAFVVGVFMFPVAATTDRPQRSTFARAVAELRSRSGRLDTSLPSQLNRLDWSVIGLYQGSRERGEPVRGAVRYFDVVENPPISGRPRIETTLSLHEVVARIVRDYPRDPAKTIEYVDPER